MLRSISFIVLAALTADLAASVQVRYVTQDDTHLVETGPSHFAIAGPKTVHSYWKNVFVNNNEITMETENCGKMTTHLDSLGADQRSLFLGIQQRLSHLGASESVSSATFMKADFEGAITKSAISALGSSYQGQRDGFSFQVQRSTMSIHRANMPFGLERVFVINDQAALVHKDGSVKMASISCLDQAEQRYVNELIALVQGHLTNGSNPVSLTVSSNNQVDPVAPSQASNNLNNLPVSAPQVPIGGAGQPVLARDTLNMPQQVVTDQSQQNGQQQQQQDNQQKKPKILSKYLKRTVNFVKDLFSMVNKGISNISGAATNNNQS